MAKFRDKVLEEANKYAREKNHELIKRRRSAMSVGGITGATCASFHPASFIAGAAFAMDYLEKRMAVRKLQREKNEAL